MNKADCLRRLLCGILICLICLCGCGTAALSDEPDLSRFIVDDSAENSTLAAVYLSRLSLHEKVCQLFFVQPEQFSHAGKVNAPDKTFYSAFKRFPVGGVILFAQNLRKKKLAALNAGMQDAAQGVNGIGVFIGADEEGGSVSRVANNLRLPEKQPAPSKIKTPEKAYESALAIGGYLSEYGINVDFAPVADVRTDIKGANLSERSYGSDPDEVSGMVARFVEGLHESGVIPVLKHFPGLGAVTGNTHLESGISERTLKQWRKVDFKPFAAGIQAGAEMVMISHQVAVKVDPDHPASLSRKVIRLLRNELGFEGVIITDALRMAAVHDQYGSGEACIRAIKAGADILLLPANFSVAYERVMKAVEEGRLTEKRIDESVLRILLLKEKYGLLR